MNIYEFMICSMFDSSIYLILVHALIKNLKTNLKDKIAYVIVVAFASTLCNILPNNILLVLVLTFVVSAFGFNTYISRGGEKNIISNIITFIFIVLILDITQLLSLTLIKLVFGYLEFSLLYGIISQIISVIFIYLLTRFTPISVLYMLTMEKKIFKLIMTSLFIMLNIIVVMWRIDSNNIAELIYSVFIIILLSMIISIILMKEGLLNKSYKEKLEIYEIYMPIIEDIIEEFRKKQHDYHNHIQTLITVNSNMNNILTEDVNDYISATLEDNVWTELLKMNNKIIIAFFYSKLVEARENNIQLHYKINNFNLHTNRTNYELVEMYGILIDNAIEASKKHEGKKEIMISLSKNVNKNIFKITNRHQFIASNHINKFFEKGFSTTKDEDKGMGLFKLRNSLNLDDENISFFYDTLSESVVVELKHC